jgi:alkylation response protein AidB-like acyl-CoA dehydrogenase
VNFAFTPEQQAFRSEVRAFFREVGPVPGAAGIGRGDDPARFRAIEQQLTARGWYTMAWPVEYGGQGADHIKQTIFREEAAIIGAPGSMMGTSVVAPAIMVHGTEEQKRRFLPPIARNEVRWCQGFSEPGAGSDLASLQTRAVRDGDDYIINVQKIWTSGAWESGPIHMLARTDPDAPKHRGISYFFLDMKTPGIRVQRLTHPTGQAELCQTFFDHVRVPADQMLGPENRGWYVATTALDFERSGIDRVAAGRRTFNDLLSFAREKRRREAERRQTADQRPTGAVPPRRPPDRPGGGPLAGLPGRLDAVARTDPERRGVDVQGVRFGDHAASRK